MHVSLLTKYSCGHNALIGNAIEVDSGLVGLVPQLIGQPLAHHPPTIKVTLPKQEGRPDSKELTLTSRSRTMVDNIHGGEHRHYYQS